MLGTETYVICYGSGVNIFARGYSRQMESADLYAAIVENSDAAIIANDLDGTVLSWNPAAELILGWTSEEMIGQPLRV